MEQVGNDRFYVARMDTVATMPGILRQHRPSFGPGSAQGPQMPIQYLKQLIQLLKQTIRGLRREV